VSSSAQQPNTTKDGPAQKPNVDGAYPLPDMTSLINVSSHFLVNAEDESVTFHCCSVRQLRAEL